MISNQSDISTPLISTGDAAEPLFQVVKRFATNRLEVPKFQREFVWTRSKSIGWANSVRQGDAVGIIVTYQLTTDDDHHPVYLSDGFQRLTASQRFYDDPKAYGFQSAEHVENCLDNFRITVQHRHYRSHNEALRAFQMMNAGTAATRHDFYKGELVNDPIGAWLYDRVLDVVDRIDSRLVKYNRRKPYKQSSNLKSDALALFGQYAMIKTTISDLWDVTSAPKIYKDTPVVEKDLAIFIDGKSKEELDALVVKFSDFLDKYAALIEERLRDVRGAGLAMAPTLLRELLHSAIYRKNCRIPVDIYDQYLCLILEHSPKLNAKIRLPEHHDGVDIGLHLGCGTHMFQIFKAFDFPYDKDMARASSDIPLKPGFENSHIQPYSTHGNGETFPEPAPLNRARGANPVQRGLI